MKNTRGIKRRGKISLPRSLRDKSYSQKMYFFSRLDTTNRRTVNIDVKIKVTPLEIFFSASTIRISRREWYKHDEACSLLLAIRNGRARGNGDPPRPENVAKPCFQLAVSSENMLIVASSAAFHPDVSRERRFRKKNDLAGKKKLGGGRSSVAQPVVCHCLVISRFRMRRQPFFLDFPLQKVVASGLIAR